MKRIAIIGAGKGGYALLCLLKDISGIEVVGIADRDKNAPGIKLAKASGIFAADDYRKLLRIKDIDIIINVTGSDAVSKNIRKKIGLKAEIVEGMSARLVWDLLNELKTEHEVLARREDYVRNLLEDSPDAIITTSTEGGIVEWSKGAEKILGYKKEEMVGRPAAELYLNPGERSKVLDCITNGKNFRNYETALKAKDGRVVDISLSISHLHDSSGKIIGTVGISKNITDDKKIRQEIDNKNRELKEVNERLEERILERTLELKRANKDLERSNRVKNQFIANMSHELRTPLNSIIGFSDILLTDTLGGLSEKQARYANNILTSGSHLLQLINNILDIAKIEAGRMTLDYSRFSLPGIIDEVMTIVQPLAAKKAVNLEVKLDSELTEITADGIKLKQILYNLLSNAIKFTPQDGRVALVAEKVAAGGAAVFEKTSADCLSARQAPGQAPGQERQLLKISVTDTGIGIRPEDIDKVFEEFEQVDGSYSRRHEGLGLGLALTKRLVELHGGIIRAESQFRKGSQFSFIMPSAIATGDKSELISRSEEKQFPRIPESEFRTAVNAPLVLVVEDDLPTSELITIHLAKAGYLVAHAFDGDEGIKKARELKPFAITLDVMLPHKDGWEVLQELKSHEETKDIPVIINSIIDNKELGFVLGAADYLIKPVDGARLIERLNEFRPMFKKRSQQPATVLLIEKDEEIVKSLSGVLEGEGFSVLSVKGGEEGIELALIAMPDLIMVDMMFDASSDISSFDIIHRLKNIPATQGIPVFLLTEKEMGTDERLKVMGYIDRVIEKGSFSKGYLVDQIKEMESLYPKRAGLVDEVTGLFNHRYLDIRLNQEIKRAIRYKQQCSLLLIAIDDLQTYIAGNGEFHGNAVLRKSAEFIKKTLRGYDIAVRYGMDEIAILLPNTPKSPALQLAKRFKTIIESYPFYNVENQPKGKISASMGVATYLDDANDMEGFISAARNALSEARGKGGDMVVAYRGA